MSKDSVYGSQELTAAEWQLVDRVKQTIRVLAKAIQHTQLERVKKDIDPQGQMDAEELETLAKQRLTPDLLNLDENEQAAAIGQLGAVIFGELTALESASSN